MEERGTEDPRGEEDPEEDRGTDEEEINETIKEEPWNWSLGTRQGSETETRRRTGKSEGTWKCTVRIRLPRG